MSLLLLIQIPIFLVVHLCKTVLIEPNSSKTFLNHFLYLRIKPFQVKMILRFLTMKFLDLLFFEGLPKYSIQVCLMMLPFSCFSQTLGLWVFLQLQLQNLVFQSFAEEIKNLWLLWISEEVFSVFSIAYLHLNFNVQLIRFFQSHFAAKFFAKFFS